MANRFNVGDFVYVDNHWDDYNNVYVSYFGRIKTVCTSNTYQDYVIEPIFDNDGSDNVSEIYNTVIPEWDLESGKNELLRRVKLYNDILNGLE